MYNIQLKQTYNFRLRATAVLGIGYDNATVTAIYDYESAQANKDVASLHVEAYPHLPSGTPRNPEDLQYYKLKLPDGQFTVIALDWISQQPELIVNTGLQVRIHGAPLSHAQQIRDILTQNGYPNVEVSAY